MNVLFVYRANLGRCQMDQVFFNHLSEITSTSAGTMVADFEGQTMAERGPVHPVWCWSRWRKRDWTFHRNKGTNPRKNWLMLRPK